MIPFLQKLKTKIVGLLGHDFFAFFFKNRREHLSYAKQLKSLYPKANEMTLLGNYELPSSVLDSLNVDSTIIAEEPKLASYTEIMRENISSDIGIEKSFINIKCKTHEKIGSLGKGEGIAALVNLLIKTG